MVEVHLTTHGLSKKGIVEFVEFCTRNEYKPIIIELNEGDIQQQPMISKVIDSCIPIEIHNKIKEIEQTFLANNFPILRTKVEVPINLSYLSKSIFPDYKGQYGEWHAKIKLNNIEELEELKNDKRFKVSNSSLRGEKLRRFITYRHYTHLDQFESYVANIRNSIKFKGYEIVKEEFEYCIFDSNKLIDKGWIDTPEITDSNYLLQKALDNLVKRYSEIDDNFVLKGSLVTRQFIKSKEVRYAQDIDFIYDGLTNENPFNYFSNWLNRITKLEIKDSVRIMPFSENEFWRRRDYAMNDDFPTTNTDLLAIFGNGQKININLDISWGLSLENEITELEYICADESKVKVRVVDLPIQIAWKLHQCVTRPRGKDFMDIILLLERKVLSNDEIRRIKVKFRDECFRDNLNPNLLNIYFDRRVSKWMNEIGYCESHFSVTSPFGIIFGVECNPKYLNRIYSEIEFSDIKDIITKFEEVIYTNNLKI